ncbi:MAG: class I SAM-dependent methyltransferase [Alphaproteobacteria bacterium]
MSAAAGPQRYEGGELALFAGAERWKRYMARALRPYIGARVIEVGAGIGGTTRHLCSDRQEEWTCIEPDPALADRIAGMIAEGTLPARCRLVRGTLDALDPDTRADTVLYVDVLEHIADDAAEISRAADRLDPGGRIVALSPAMPALYSAFDRAIGHHRRYRAADAARLACPGLAVERIYHLDAVGALASLANRLLLRAAAPDAAQVRFWDRVLVPASTLVDPLLRHRLGRSVVMVWRRTGGTPAR